MNSSNRGTYFNEPPRTNISKSDPPKIKIPENEPPKTILEKSNHPLNWKNIPLQEKEEKKRYSVYSDIQEMQDRLQTLYASGSSFAEQKTIDISESEYRMLPIEMFHIVKKNLFFILMTYLVAFVIFLVSSYYKVFQGALYPVPLSIFFFSFMFYGYVTYAMRQFVIDDEKQPKTKQFYKIILSAWRVVETFLVSLVFLFGFIIWKYDFIASLLSKFEKFEFLKKLDYKQALDHLFYLSIIATLIYFFFAYFVNKKFKRIQKENMLALYAQYNRTEAINKKLQGEL